MNVVSMRPLLDGCGLPAADSRIARVEIFVLLIANLTQMVTHSALLHTGYFKEVARIGMSVVVAMTGVAFLAFARELNIVQFLEAYTAVYACGALAAVVLVIRGPIRFAYGIAGAPKVAPR